MYIVCNFVNLRSDNTLDPLICPGKQILSYLSIGQRVAPQADAAGQKVIETSGKLASIKPCLKSEDQQRDVHR